MGSALLESARALAELATDEDRFGNAIAVVAVHAAIAYNDALTIAFRSVKSTEGDHAKAADTLLFALSHHAPAARVEQLRSILKNKDRVSYQGSYYTVRDAGTLLGEVDAFCRWAEDLYQRRPSA